MAPVVRPAASAMASSRTPVPSRPIRAVAASSSARRLAAFASVRRTRPPPPLTAPELFRNLIIIVIRLRERGGSVPVQTARLDQAVQLADGRALGYAEYGPAGGPPLFVFHGLPGSRLAVPEMWPGEPGPVRVIAPDRPGLGTSTPQPGRRLTDWAGDVRQLADALGIRQFAVAGFSGGGPHALAVAHALPGRVTAVGSIAGAGRLDTRPARTALKQANPANRLIFALARKAPRLLSPVIAQHARGMTRDPAKIV